MTGGSNVESVPAAVAGAIAAVRAGELIVVPTDTVYGLCCRPDDPSATARLFAAKGRGRERSLPVLAASFEDARRVASFDARAEAAAGRAWPGPVTFVLPRAAESRPWNLGEQEATVAIRIPRHPLALIVLERTGPLAASSANRSGEPVATSCEEITTALGDAVAITLCEDRPPGVVPSGVIDLTGGEARILRRGPLTDEQIQAVLAGE